MICTPFPRYELLPKSSGGLYFVCSGGISIESAGSNFTVQDQPKGGMYKEEMQDGPFI